MSVSDFFTLLGACVGILVASVLYDVWKHRRAAADDYDNPDADDRPLESHPKPATPPVAATATAALPPVAMPRNEGNGELPRNERLRVQADIIARLLQAGVYVPDGKGGYRQVKQTAMIKLATGIVPNSRPDSEYGQLRAELEPLINPQLLVAAGRPEERQIAKV